MSVKKLLYSSTLLSSIIGASVYVQAAVLPIANTTPTPTPAASNPLSCHDFQQNLRVGMKSAEVRFLQANLIKENFSIPATSFGNYDNSTMAAVKAFQEKYFSEILSPAKLSAGSGFLGKATRNKLNSLYGCGALVSAPTPADITANIAVTNISLDPTGLSLTACNKGNTIPTFPIRVRLNGINRDFDIVGALNAGTCDTNKFVYETWGLSYDAGSTLTAVVVMDPNAVYKKSHLTYPVDGTASIKIPAVNGLHLAARSILLKSNGVQVTVCNLGTTNLNSFPIRITVNGNSKDFDVPEAYQAGKCQAKTWGYESWGLTYVAGNTYSATAVTDPNDIYKEVSELDNAASVIGTP